MPTLPSLLKPVVANYSIDEPGGVIRTEVAGGAARYALDFDRGTQRFQVTLLLDSLQFSMWTAFYHHIIKKGAISFDMPLDSGFGVSVHRVNIVPGSYSAVRTSGILMVVSYVAEAENKVYEFSAADAVSLLAFYELYGPYSSHLLARLAQFATKDMNILGAA